MSLMQHYSNIEFCSDVDIEFYTLCLAMFAEAQVPFRASSGQKRWKSNNSSEW